MGAWVHQGSTSSLLFREKLRSESLEIRLRLLSIQFTSLSDSEPENATLRFFISRHGSSLGKQPAWNTHSETMPFFIMSWTLLGPYYKAIFLACFSLLFDIKRLVDYDATEPGRESI